jgi:hypothetical protein
VRRRLLLLTGITLVVVLLCAGTWLLLRPTGATQGVVPAPITIPSRESATSTSPAPAPPPPASEPTDVVAPPPPVDDDDDDDAAGDDGDD